MKKSLSRVLVGLGLLLVLAGCSKGTASQSSPSSQSSAGETATDKTILVGMRGDSPKMSFTNEKGEFTGFEVDVFKALEEVIPGYRFELVQTEFPSLFTSLQEGKLDVVASGLRTSAEREANYLHTGKSYMHEPYRLTVLGTNEEIKEIADLDGQNVGVGEGSLQAKLLQDFMDKTGAKINLVYLSAADYPSALATKKIAAVIAPAFALEVYNDSFKDQNITFKAVNDNVEKDLGVDADSNAYFFLAKGSDELSKILSDGIVKLRESGRLSEISLQYFTEDQTANIDTTKETE